MWTFKQQDVSRICGFEKLFVENISIFVEIGTVSGEVSVLLFLSVRLFDDVFQC